MIILSVRDVFAAPGTTSAYPVVPVETASRDTAFPRAGVLFQVAPRPAGDGLDQAFPESDNCGPAAETSWIR